MVENLKLKFEDVFAFVLLFDFKSHGFTKYLVMGFVNVT